MGIAHDEGDVAMFRPDWEYRPYFSVPDVFFEQVEGAKDHPGEFLQDLAHWKSIRMEILGFFQPAEAIRPEVDSRWELTTQGSLHTTAIHVRRTDYTYVPKRFPTCTKRYYDEAIARVRAENPYTHFIVFSDDINFCRNHMFRGEDFTYFEGVVRPMDTAHRKKSEPQDYWDLFMMARCDDHIIANSSFSWWGATLAMNNRAYYPSVWYGPELKEINWKEEMIPETWIEVPC